MIRLPIESSVLESLSAGEKVLFTGKIYTARDKAHRLIVDLLNENEGKDFHTTEAKLPFPLKNSIIYYSGPVLDKKTGQFTSAGPTTSSRMDSLTPQLLAAGVKGFIGKGPRSGEIRKLLAFHRAVYFSTVGGAGVLLAQRIKEAKVVAFSELLAEAVYELQVEEFPCYVAIDSRGKSMFTAR